MTEIKIRAWLKGLNEIVEVDELRYFPNDDGKLELCNIWFTRQNSLTRAMRQIIDVDLMQFTGLKDMGGKEIFEGDIVKWNDGRTDKPSWRVAVVKVHNGTTNFVIIENKMHELTAHENYVFQQGGFAYQRTEKHLIKCGNIYENPELLTNPEYVKNVYKNPKLWRIY